MAAFNVVVVLVVLVSVAVVLDLVVLVLVVLDLVVLVLVVLVRVAVVLVVDGMHARETIPKASPSTSVSQLLHTSTSSYFKHRGSEWVGAAWYHPAAHAVQVLSCVPSAVAVK
jgi:hypothetical protein